MYSDRNLKENINPLDDETADKVLKFTPVAFNLKGGSKLQYGFIAQDIEEILPNLVYKNDRGVRSVAYNQIIPLLLHQIQQLTERVAQLEQSRNSQ